MYMPILVSQFSVDPLLTVVFLYVGPETMLPLMSALAAGIGILLMAWRRVAAWVRKAWRFCFARSRTDLQQ